MHPIEHLRAVARAHDVPQALLAREVAAALLSIAGDPAELVTVCRRIVDRQPAAGVLWNLCARALCADDPSTAAWRFVDELEGDTAAATAVDGLPQDATVVIVSWPLELAPSLARRGDVEYRVVDAAGIGSRLATELEREGARALDIAGEGLGAAVASADLVLLEAELAGPEAFLAASGSRAAAAVARHAGGEVRVVLPTGRLLDRATAAAAFDRLGRRGAPWDASDEVVSADLVDVVVRSGSHGTVHDLASGSDGPAAPELLKEID